MNFTLDDTSPQLIYSTNWGIQSASDPIQSEFFGGTFHAAQTDGASVNMSVSGTDVYLYGSKGPGHGNYSVQFDGAITFLSAYAPQTQYQQLLFHHTFDPTTSSPHFVSLTAHLSGSGVRVTWFDFDFVTTTASSNSTNPLNNAVGPANTVVPPWRTPSQQSTSASPSPTSSVAGAISGSSRSTTKIPTILAVLFGSIIALVLLLLLLYYALRKIHDTKRAREHNFRYGARRHQMNTSVSTSVINPNNNNTPTGPSSSHWNLINATSSSLQNPTNHNRNMTQTSSPLIRGLDLTTPPASPGYASTLIIGDPRNMDVTLDREGHSMRSEYTAATVAPTITSMTPLAFYGHSGNGHGYGYGHGHHQMSPPPVSFHHKKYGKKKGKGDADSLRTDFLQV